MVSASKVFTIENLGDEKYVQDVSRELRVTVNGIMYEKSIVSRIEVFKFCSDESIKPVIFASLYMGNVRLASWLQDKAVVLSEDRHYQSGELYGYLIRTPHSDEK